MRYHSFISSFRFLFIMRCMAIADRSCSRSPSSLSAETDSVTSIPILLLHSVLASGFSSASTPPSRICSRPPSFTGSRCVGRPWAPTGVPTGLSVGSRDPGSQAKLAMDVSSGTSVRWGPRGKSRPCSSWRPTRKVRSKSSPCSKANPSASTAPGFAVCRLSRCDEAPACTVAMSTEGSTTFHRVVLAGRPLGARSSTSRTWSCSCCWDCSHAWKRRSSRSWEESPN
mmetsp:Transcript_39654/g.95236  ORF Transcript_39654/g.95236 Transcript_39654/m.95236 type:complete len:227 (-) Transcript_39654:1228-1908(-)